MAAPPLRQVQRHKMHRGQKLGAGVNYATPLHPQLPYSKSASELDVRYRLPVCDGRHNNRRRQPPPPPPTPTTTTDDGRRRARVYSSCGLKEVRRSILGGGKEEGAGCRCRWRMRVSLGSRFCNSKKMMMTTKPTTATSSAERTDERKARSLQDTSLFVTS